MGLHENVALLSRDIAASLLRLETVTEMIRDRGLAEPHTLRIVGEDLLRAQAKLVRALELGGERPAEVPAAPMSGVPAL